MSCNMAMARARVNSNLKRSKRLRAAVVKVRGSGFTHGGRSDPHRGLM